MRYFPLAAAGTVHSGVPQLRQKAFSFDDLLEVSLSV
jgi:hypothetical protein